MDNPAGTLTDISGYVNSVDGLPGDTDTGETTTLGKQSKTYIAGLHDASPSLSGVWDAALTTIVGTQTEQKIIRSFEYGPAGGGSGKVKQSGEAIITSYTVSSPVGDVVTFSISLQKTGDITEGTFT